MVSHEHDPPLTEAQRDYLAAFDRYLHGEAGATDRKARALICVLDEAGVDRRGGCDRRGGFQSMRFRRAA